MNFHPTSLDGVFLIDLIHHQDERGSFIKTFHDDSFKQHGIDFTMAESFYSTSAKGVIRGMHFQLPPHDHDKIVYCTTGVVLDVVLDLRKDQSTFGQYVLLELHADNPKAVFIPKGLAHGFAGLSDEPSTLVYNTGTVHNSDADAGVRWDSFGFSWPIEEAVISERDRSFPALEQFESPF